MFRSTSLRGRAFPTLQRTSLASGRLQTQTWAGALSGISSCGGRRSFPAAPAGNSPKTAAAFPCFRAKEIVQTGKLQGIQVEEDGGVRKRKARCQGSDGGAYEVTAAVSAAGDWADLTCTCPAAEKQALCKHGLALLLHGVPLPADEPAAQPDAPPPQPAPPAAPAAPPGGGGRRKLPASMLQAPAAAAK